MAIDQRRLRNAPPRRARRGAWERPPVTIHAEHPVLILDRSACGRQVARGEADDATCKVCKRVLAAYQAHTREVQAARRRAYATAMLQLRDRHRAEFDAIWRSLEATAVETILVAELAETGKAIRKMLT